MSTQIAESGPEPLDPVKDPADRSILIGVVATVLFHLLLVLLSPQFSFDSFSGVHSGIAVNNTNRGKTFDFELASPTLPEERRPESQYVDTNPNAPENEPDKTSNFSNRNQQTAQEVAAKELDPQHRPSVETDRSIEQSNAIVAGRMDQAMASTPVPTVATNSDTDRVEQRLRMAQTPDAGFDKTKGESEEGIATNIATTKAPSTHAEQTLEGAQNGKSLEGGLVVIDEARRAQPKARPRLTFANPNALTNRVQGTNNIGIIGQDARWSEYGEYLGEVFAVIAAVWHQTVDESRFLPPRGSFVVVTFKINSHGETEVVKIEDSGAGKQGVMWCQNAIQARQPYRKWTQQMITVLGDEQELKFGFYY